MDVFIHQKKALLDELAFVALAARTGRKREAYRSGVLLETVDSGYLALHCADFHVSTSSFVDAEIRQTGEFVVSARSLLKALRAAENGAVSLTVVGQSLEVKTVDGSTFRLSAIGKAEHFPPPPTPPREHAAHLPGKELARMIKQVEKVVDGDITRPFMQGVYVRFQDGVSFETTNGKSIAKAWCHVPAYGDVEGFAHLGVFLIAAKAFAKADRVSLAFVDDSFGPQNAGMWFRSDRRQLRGIRNDAQFPAKQAAKFIDEKRPLKIYFQREDLLKAVRLVGDFEPFVDAVTVDVKPSELVLSGKGEDGSVEKAVRAETGAAKLHLFFNWRYLRDLLVVMVDSQIALSLSDGKSSVRFDDTCHLHILMPKAHTGHKA